LSNLDAKHASIAIARMHQAVREMSKSEGHLVSLRRRIYDVYEKIKYSSPVTKKVKALTADLPI
jgi:hypothetical protein